MGIRREICEAVMRLEKSAGFGDWWARQSRRAWGGIGAAAANVKYVTDAIGNAPRMWGGKNWWGDDFQSNSWKDYNRMGYQTGQDLSGVGASRIANVVTLGMSDTVHDLMDNTDAEAEGKFHGEERGRRAQLLSDMRHAERDYGRQAMIDMYDSVADDETVRMYLEGDKGISDDIRLAGNGIELAGDIAFGAYAGHVAKGVSAVGKAGKYAAKAIAAAPTAMTIYHAGKEEYDNYKAQQAALDQYKQQRDAELSAQEAELSTQEAEMQYRPDGLPGGSMMQNGFESQNGASWQQYVPQQPSWGQYVHNSGAYPQNAPTSETMAYTGRSGLTRRRRN